jgi:uncharacterized membrane protein YesL
MGLTLLILITLVEGAFMSIFHTKKHTISTFGIVAIGKIYVQAMFYMVSIDFNYDGMLERKCL